MPKRTNEHQAVVFFVKKHIAPPDAIVTESKLLTDVSTGEKREVDIVIEFTSADEEVVISVEVTNTKRRATVVPAAAWPPVSFREPRHCCSSATRS